MISIFMILYQRGLIVMRLFVFKVVHEARSTSQSEAMTAPWALPVSERQAALRIIKENLANSFAF
jgi:hypothetical protein